MNRKNKQRDLKQAITFLQENGLTRYESIVLAYLTTHKTATAKEIHKQSEVPLPKVYQTLELLKDKQFIFQELETRPVKYGAYDPEIIVGRIKQANRQAETLLKESLDKLQTTELRNIKGELSPFFGEEEFKRIALKLFRDTEKNFSMVISPEIIGSFQSEILQMKKRGITIRSIMLQPISKMFKEFQEKKYQKFGSQHHEIKLSKGISPPRLISNNLKQILEPIKDFVGIMISDKREAIVLIPLFPQESYFGVWIYSPQIVSRQIDIFEKVYAKSEI
jgi:sugar-specific transcriptional regulator TrmB